MNRETEFETFLTQEKTVKSPKAVATRMSRARSVENLFGQSLDYIVANDDRMYDSLMVLRAQEDNAHSPMQNAVRKYYKFVHGKEFPQLRYYKR